VRMTWINGDDYDMILVTRDGRTIASLPGGAAGDVGQFFDRAPPTGEHTYCVVGVANGRHSLPACCSVLVPGPIPPPQDLVCRVLYPPLPADIQPLADDLTAGAPDLDGERLDYFPLEPTAQARVKPIYETMPGWPESTEGARTFSELPAAAVKYVVRVEELIGAHVALLSTSPERDDTILMRDPFAD